MLANLTGWHAILIVAILLLLFGASKIPLLARGLGQSMQIFKDAVKPEPGSGTSSSTADLGATEPGENDASVPRHDVMRSRLSAGIEK